MSEIGKVIRTRLTDLEWREIQRIAAARSLDASQLVTQVLRGQLLENDSDSRKVS